MGDVRVFIGYLADLGFFVPSTQTASPFKFGVFSCHYNCSTLAFGTYVLPRPRLHESITSCDVTDETRKRRSVLSSIVQTNSSYIFRDGITRPCMVYLPTFS